MAGAGRPVKILVTGHKGFVGSNVYEHFVRSGAEVHALDRDTTNYTDWAIEAQKTVQQPWDAVVLCGGISTNTYTDFDIALWNAEAPRMLANIAWSVNPDCHVIFFSTSMVALTDRLPAKRTPYVWSKRFAEQFILDDRRQLPGNTPLTILRPVVIWGDERGFPKGSRSLAFLMANHEMRHVWKDRMRPHIHIDDVVRAVDKCVKGELDGGLRYNLTSGDYVTNEDMVDCLQWTGFKLVDPPPDAWLDQYAHLSVRELNWYSKLEFPIKCERSVREDLPKLEKELNNEL